MKKKYLILIFLIIIIVFLFLLKFKHNNLDQNLNDIEYLKIRLNAPLTGSFAYYGTETKNALELYFNKNKILLENKGILLDYSFQDNTGSVKESLNNAKLFLSEDNLDILVSTNTPL